MKLQPHTHALSYNPLQHLWHRPPTSLAGLAIVICRITRHNARMRRPTPHALDTLHVDRRWRRKVRTSNALARSPFAVVVVWVCGGGHGVRSHVFILWLVWHWRCWRLKDASDMVPGRAVWRAIPNSGSCFCRPLVVASFAGRLRIYGICVHTTKSL